MPWTERQRAMLREMGIVLWAPEAVAPPAENDVVVAAASTARAHAGAGAATAPRAGGMAAVDAPRAGSTTAVDAPPVPARAETSPPQRRAEGGATTGRLPGLAPADWLVVAEPLDDGDPQQQQLLDNMLRAIGVALVAPNRERRAVFCPVAPAPATSATRPSREAEAAHDQRLADDRAALQAAIATVAPRCILAFGRAGAAALLGDDAPLGGLRGRVHRHDGVPVVVTFSLVFLLRHQAEKAKAWADLCLAVGSLEATAT